MGWKSRCSHPTPSGKHQLQRALTGSPGSSSVSDCAACLFSRYDIRLNYASSTSGGLSNPLPFSVFWWCCSERVWKRRRVFRGCFHLLFARPVSPNTGDEGRDLCHSEGKRDSMTYPRQALTGVIYFREARRKVLQIRLRPILPLAARAIEKIFQRSKSRMLPAYFAVCHVIPQI